MRSIKFKDEYKGRLYNYLFEESKLANDKKNLENSINNLLKDSYREYVIDKNELELCKDNRVYISLKGVIVKLVDLNLSDDKTNNFVPNKVLEEDTLIPNLTKTLYKSIIQESFVFNYLENEIQLPAIIGTNDKGKSELIIYRRFKDDIDKFPEEVLNKLRTAFIDYCKLIHKINNFSKISAINGKSTNDIETLDELKLTSEYWYNLVKNFMEEDKNMDIFPNNYNIEDTLKKLKTIIEEK